MASQIRFRCYYCHRVHTVDATAAGKKGRCPCGKLMVVPRPQAGEGPPEPPDVLPQATAPEAGDADVPGVDIDARSASMAPPTVPERKVAEPVVSPSGMGAPSRQDRAWASTEEPARAGGGVLRILAALPVLAVGVAHTFHEHLDLSLPAGPDYLGLPAVLWSTLLFSLGGLLLFEGILRVLGRVEQ